MEIIKFETERLLMRKLEYLDRDDIFEILSDEQTSLDSSGYHACKAKDDEFDKLMKAFCTPDRFGVILKETGKVIGMINLMEEERAVPCYELGFVINKDYRRKGYMSEAVSGLIGKFFSDTDIQMFTACHFPDNKASEELIKKLGFRYEGISHKAMKHAVLGAVDLVCYYKDKTEK